MLSPKPINGKGHRITMAAKINQDSSFGVGIVNSEESKIPKEHATPYLNKIEIGLARIQKGVSAG